MTIRLIVYVMPFALALARRYSTPLKDTYVVAKRCPPDRPDAWEETYFKSKDKALVSCCKIGEEKGFRKVNGECAKEVNHTDAIAFCVRGGMLTFPFIDETTISLYSQLMDVFALGGRLCSLDELHTKTCATGCNLDKAVVWTSVPYGPHRHMVIF